MSFGLVGFGLGFFERFVLLIVGFFVCLFSKIKRCYIIQH